jgi:hypothetical protein
MKIRQYRPAFFEGFENYEGEVNSVAELGALEFLQGIQSDPDFHRFSLDRYYWAPTGSEPIHMLMAETHGGSKWWTMAKLQGNDLEPFSQLPEWNPKPNARL